LSKLRTFARTCRSSPNAAVAVPAAGRRLQRRLLTRRHRHILIFTAGDGGSDGGTRRGGGERAARSAGGGVHVPQPVGRPGSVLLTGVEASGLHLSAPSFGAALVAGPSGGRPARLQIGAVSDVAAVVRWRFLLLTVEMTPVAELSRWPCHRRRPVRRRWVPLSLFSPLPRLPLCPHPPALHLHTVTLSTPPYSAFSHTRGAAAAPPPRLHTTCAASSLGSILDLGSQAAISAIACAHHHAAASSRERDLPHGLGSAYDYGHSAAPPRDAASAACGGGGGRGRGERELPPLPASVERLLVGAGSGAYQCKYQRQGDPTSAPVRECSRRWLQWQRSHRGHCRQRTGLPRRSLHPCCPYAGRRRVGGGGQWRRRLRRSRQHCFAVGRGRGGSRLWNS